MSKHNSKSKVYFLIALLFLAFLSTACGNDDTITPTAEVITGEETLDAIIEDTNKTVGILASGACSLCRFNEGGENGDACNCNGICNAEVECKAVESEGE